MNYTNTNLDAFSNMILTDVGRAIVEDKQDVIDILENAGVEVDPSSSNIELVDAYINALPNNEQLLLGTSYYIQLKNSSGFDGVDNDSIYSMYDKLYDTWMFDEEDEETSNAVGAIAGIAKTGFNIGQKMIDRQDERRHGASRAVQKQAEARAEMIKAIAAQKEAKRKELEIQEANRKKKRTKLIVISSVALVAVIVGLVVYTKAYKKGKS